MKWDSSTDRLILLAILETHPVTLDYAAVAQKIGNGCTARAVSNQIWKLKKMAAESPSFGNKASPQTFKKGGKLGKGSFYGDDEETKNFKPQARPFLQKSPKTEEGAVKIKEERGDVIIKHEHCDGPSDAMRRSANTSNQESIVTIDDDDNDDDYNHE